MKQKGKKNNKGNGIPNLFDLIYLFTYVSMSATKYILPETESFSATLLHHKGGAKSSIENLPNLTYPLASNTETGNYNFNFKESTIQPERLEFVEEISKYMSSHEYEKPWNLFNRRELNG